MYVLVRFILIITKTPPDFILGCDKVEEDGLVSQTIKRRRKKLIQNSIKTI